MKLPLKKLARSLQVRCAWLPDAKFAAHHAFHRLTGRLFKADFGGISRFAWQGRLLLDVGANRGQSIVAFRNAMPGCQIVAFEANPVLAARLARRHRNDPNLRVETCALWSKPGELRLYVPLYNGYLFDGLASVHRHEAEDWLNADRLYGFDRRKLSIRELSVSARTLDSLGLAPVFIKLSVQRAEIGVLEGAEETLRRHRPVLLCAYPWDALTGFLAERGYRPHAFRGGRFLAGERGREFTWFLLEEHAAAVAG